MSADYLISKLNHVKEVKPRRKNKRSWIAQCPAHNDKNPSLYVDEAPNGNVLVKCWSGCGAIDVIRSVGEEWPILFPEDGYRQEAKKIVQDVNYHELRLEIGRASRGRGEKQSKADKDSELESWKALRGSN